MEKNTTTGDKPAKQGLDPKFSPIIEAKADEAVKLAIKMCSEDPNANSEAILAIDQRFFC